MVADNNFKLSEDEKFIINYLYMCAAGLYVNREEVETERDKKVKVYKVSVPKEYAREGRSLNMLSNRDLAILFEDFVKSDVKRINEVKRKLGKEEVMDVKVKFTVRNEIWDYGRYQDRKRNVIRGIEEKGLKVSDVVGYLDEKYGW